MPLRLPRLSGFRRLSPERRRLAQIGGALLLTALLASAVWLGTTVAGGRQRAPLAVSARPPARPLTLGTNLALYDGNDQVVNSRATQQLLRDAGVPIIRMPFRSAQGDIHELEALRAIQYIGAIPFVIVHGPTDPNALADDRQLVALVRSVFGNEQVYVEFGNEPDLAGGDVGRYLAAWESAVPSLKAMAPTYRFVGPAVSGPDPAYFVTFASLARPRPDAISWHEYACHPGSSDSDCFAGLSDWTAHIQQAHQAVLTETGRSLPIMITEWNLDDQPDARYDSQSFMRAWTARALQTLAANQHSGLIAALQYCVTSDGQLSLLDSTNAPTPEGSIFFQGLKHSAPPA